MPASSAHCGSVSFSTDTPKNAFAAVCARVEPLPEINPVEIIAENLVLGVVLLDAAGEKDLEQLAVIGALHVPDAVARELLGDAAATLTAPAPVQHVAHQRAAGAKPVHGAMLVEAPVLLRDDGLRQQLGHRFVGPASPRGSPRRNGLKGLFWSS